MTQENMGPPQKHQHKVTLNGQEVWADPELIPLLKALNDAGLVTRSHCCGHGKDPAWVAIRSDNIDEVQIRTHGEYNEVLITWWPKS